MKKIIFILLIALSLAGCNANLDRRDDSSNTYTDIENNVEKTLDETKNLQKLFPKYKEEMDLIANEINMTLSELETKDENYFEENPEEGILFLNEIINDYEDYINKLQNLEYNTNSDIKYVNNLFIDGLEENINVFELSIDLLKNNSYDEEKLSNQLEIVANKFSEFGEEYRNLAEKANYSE